MTRRFGQGCGNWQPSAVGSAIGGWFDPVDRTLLAREGIGLNHKKLRRLYAEEKLQARRRAGRKRAVGTRAPMVSPQAPNQRWLLDFVSDALDDGSASWRWSMTSAASAWRWWPTPRCPVSGSHANWIR
jgi:transposase InsO family protein